MHNDSDRFGTKLHFLSINDEVGMICKIGTLSIVILVHLCLNVSIKHWLTYFGNVCDVSNK